MRISEILGCVKRTLHELRLASQTRTHGSVPTGALLNSYFLLVPKLNLGTQFPPKLC
jgi:hypothetical protein